MGAGDEDRAVLVATPTISLMPCPPRARLPVTPPNVHVAIPPLRLLTQHIREFRAGPYFGRGLGTRLCQFVSPVINLDIDRSKTDSTDIVKKVTYVYIIEINVVLYPLLYQQHKTR